MFYKLTVKNDKKGDCKNCKFLDFRNYETEKLDRCRKCGKDGEPIGRDFRNPTTGNNKTRNNCAWKQCEKLYRLTREQLNADLIEYGYEENTFLGRFFLFYKIKLFYSFLINFFLKSC